MTAGGRVSPQRIRGVAFPAGNQVYQAVHLPQVEGRSNGQAKEDVR